MCDTQRTAQGSQSLFHRGSPSSERSTRRFFLHVISVFHLLLDDLSISLPLQIGLSSADFLSQELHALISAQSIGQVWRQHRQRTDADQVTWLADNVDLVGREVRDLVIVL